MFLNIWFLFFYWCLNGVWFWGSHCAFFVRLQSLMNTPQPQAVLIASVSQPGTWSSKKWVAWLHELRLICLGWSRDRHNTSTFWQLDLISQRRSEELNAVLMTRVKTTILWNKSIHKANPNLFPCACTVSVPLTKFHGSLRYLLEPSHYTSLGSYHP